MIAQNTKRTPKNLWSDRGRGLPITRYEAEDEHDEAGFVVDQIEKLREEGFDLADMAVFYRTNAMSRVVEDVFVRRGIPYSVVGSVKFYDRKEVKDALAYLRAIVNPSDEVSVKRIINEPRRGIGSTTIAHLDRFAQSQRIDFFAALRRVAEVPQLNARAQGQVLEFVALIESLREKAEEEGVVAAMEAVLDDTGLVAALEAERTIEAMGRVENLKELVGVANEFESSSEGAVIGDEEYDTLDNIRRVELFLETTSLVADIDEWDEGAGAVTLMTLHTAKGLEFPVVFIIGMEDGVFPHMRSLGEPDELEEERRLAYVGITRAMDRLYLTSAWNRMLFGGSSYNPPSRFLQEIPEQLVTKISKRKMQPSGRSPAERAAFTGPATKVDPSQIGPGDRVRHGKWGLGTVREVVGEGDKAEAEVMFDTQGKKRLLLAWALSRRPRSRWHPGAVPARGELLDTLPLQHADDVVVVDAEPGKSLEVGTRRGDVVVGEGLRARIAVVLVGVDGLERHGVDGARRHQFLHVEQVVVGGVLGRGRCPQRLLPAGALGSQGLESPVAETLQIEPVGGSCIGDGGLAEERTGLFRVDGLQPLVDLGVEPGDEERGHREHPTGVAVVCDVILETAQVGVDHLVVSLQREDQGHVDRDALGREGPDGGHALRSGGHLDQEIGAIDRGDPVPGLFDGGIGVSCEYGRDLHGHEPVAPIGGFPDRSQRRTQPGCPPP